MNCLASSKLLPVDRSTTHWHLYYFLTPPAAGLPVQMQRNEYLFVVTSPPIRRAYYLSTIDQLTDEFLVPCSSAPICRD